MEVTKAKLKNLESGKEIVLAVNPSSYELSRNFDFVLEPRLAQSAPLVAFRNGGAAALKLQLLLDQDVPKGSDALKQAREFLTDLPKIYEKTASVSPVEFKMGALSFQGYIRSYRFTAKRFDPKGEPTSAVLDLELIAGADEEGSQK